MTSFASRSLSQRCARCPLSNSTALRSVGTFGRDVFNSALKPKNGLPMPRVMPLCKVSCTDLSLISQSRLPLAASGKPEASNAATQTDGKRIAELEQMHRMRRDQRDPHEADACGGEADREPGQRDHAGDDRRRCQHDPDLERR